MADLHDEIERETSYRITDEDIERSRLLVGHDAPRGGREFYKVLFPDAIRNFARGYGDDNPLFVDEEYGATTRWGSQIAPYSSSTKRGLSSP